MINVSDATPRNFVICSSSILPKTLTWSMYFTASRAHHSDILAISSIASSVAVSSSFSQIILSRFPISFLSIFLKLKTWQREMMVSGTFWISVVASMKQTLSLGSSMVFKSALNAHLLSMWTSSMTYIFFFKFAGGYAALSKISSLMLSTPVCEAASIST